MPRQLVKHYYWVCLCGCFQNRFSIWISRLNKNDISILMWASLIQSAGDLNRDEGKVLFICLSWDVMFSCFQTLGTLVPGSLNPGLTSAAPLSEDLQSCSGSYTISSPGFSGLLIQTNLYHWLSQFFNLQMADYGTFQPLKL